MAKKKPNKKYKLDEISDYLTKIELGENPTIEEIDTIGEYIEELKSDTLEED